ncbi:hypothetical protein M406DRAFT_75522 [Cryphonectria parasitica EP155]|uniref:Uncharacterized protein n=1 Tax=Cryphonectria parasitica (strain ATCC 38755 / EP155) TaxID=660469 RepID=A0A9P4Y7L8_CRYP1|nr:uncharacterized protein M406DRAFT_75522 [Cryphonectria parasitica EP155]KAF3768211.1 hypothetical protein M406DRAFT_75522 [Cryphonectria parasitica EP155]
MNTKTEAKVALVGIYEGKTFCYEDSEEILPEFGITGHISDRFGPDNVELVSESRNRSRSSSRSRPRLRPRQQAKVRLLHASLELRLVPRNTIVDTSDTESVGLVNVDTDTYASKRNAYPTRYWSKTRRNHSQARDDAGRTLRQHGPDRVLETKVHKIDGMGWTKMLTVATPYPRLVIHEAELGHQSDRDPDT